MLVVDDRFLFVPGAMQQLAHQLEDERAPRFRHAVAKNEHLTTGKNVPCHVDSTHIGLRITAKIDQKLLICQHKIEQRYEKFRLVGARAKVIAISA